MSFFLKLPFYYREDMRYPTLVPSNPPFSSLLLYPLSCSFNLYAKKLSIL